MCLDFETSDIKNTVASIADANVSYIELTEQPANTKRELGVEINQPFAQGKAHRWSASIAAG